MQIYKHLKIHILTNTHTHTYTPIYRNTNVQTPTQTHNYIQIHTNTSTQAYKHTYAYAHTYTNIHLHKFIHQSAMNMLIIPYTWFDKGQYDSSNEHIVCTTKSATLTYIKIAASLCLSFSPFLPPFLLRALYPSVFLSPSLCILPFYINFV